MSDHINRRRFIQGSLMAGAVATGFVSVEERILTDALAKGLDRPDALDQAIAGPMPMGKLGNLSISRFVSGGNLLGGWAHSRDLLYVSQLMQAYNTDQKKNETFALLEKAGVNTVQVDMTQVEQVRKYNQTQGGRFQIISSVRPLWGLWTEPAWDEIKKDIDRVIDEQGVQAVYIHGGYADKLTEAALKKGTTENIEYMGRIIDYIRSKGLPAGLGSHALEVPMECDKLGIEPDFYFKTFHDDRYWSASPKEARLPFSVDRDRDMDHDAVHDNIFDLDPQATARYMKSKKQPWFAFKTMAAGALPPKDAFKYAFENGADFIVAGMFDFQVVQNVNLIVEVLNDLPSRERPWMA